MHKKIKQYTLLCFCTTIYATALTSEPLAGWSMHIQQVRHETRCEMSYQWEQLEVFP